MKSDYLKNVVWAVDTFEDRQEFQKGPMALLRALTRPTQAAVEPVHILSPPYVPLELPLVPPGAITDFEQAYQGLAEKRLLEISQVSDISTMSAGKVLPNHTHSTVSAVKVLVDYAEKRNADAIVVATHARTGLPRLFLGSFAETLLLKSTIPVITVNPDTKIRERISRILLPTTFQSNFRAGFKKVAQLSKILDARLTVFYKEPAMPSAFMSPTINEYIKRERSVREVQAREWQEWAARFNVPVDVYFDNVPGKVADAIENYARDKDVDLIAMVSQADSISVPLMGSIARQVVRSAPCPVWVMRAEKEE